MAVFPLLGPAAGHAATAASTTSVRLASRTEQNLLTTRDFRSAPAGWRAVQAVQAVQRPGFTLLGSGPPRPEPRSLGQGPKVGARPDEVRTEFSGCPGRLSRPPGKDNVALGFGGSIL